MRREFSVDIRPESSILGTYKNQSYKIESAFAEFIDNATQSFFDYRDVLAKTGQTSCDIEIEIFKEYILIRDNAYGMDEEAFRRALKLNSPPKDTSGRSEKGMGLKTSATCLGSFWTVETTRYGSSIKYYAQVDVDEISKNAPETMIAWADDDCDKNEHYTIIKIQNLNKTITPNKITSLSKLLGEMYALDFRKKQLSLTINKQPITYSIPDLWINPETGAEYKVVFDREYEVNNKKYRFDGWIGIREKADTEFSGMNIFRKGRAIKVNYRPQKLLGKPNSFPYQRIIGEIYLKGDNWEPSYTKDELMWEGEQEEKFIDELKSAASVIIKKSSELRKEDRAVSKEHQKQIATNVGKSFKSVDSEEISKIINKQDSSISVLETESSETIINDDEYEKIDINIQGINYLFNVKFLKNDHDSWITLTTNTDNENEYDLMINYGLDYFKNYNLSRPDLELMQKLVITICISLITAKNSGDPDAYRILQLLNTIVRSAK